MTEFIRGGLFTSQGLYNREIARACLDLVGRDPGHTKVAIVDLGSAAEPESEEWVAASKEEARQNFRGGAVEVDPTTEPQGEVARKILGSHVLFMLAGNCDFQVHEARRTGFAQILPELLQSVVLVTVSGATMAMGHRISSEAYQAGYGGEEARNDYGAQPFLGIVNAGFMPHLGTSWAPGVTTTLLNDCADDLPFNIYGMPDDTALVVEGTTQRWVGASPYYVVPAGARPGDEGHFEYPAR